MRGGPRSRSDRRAGVAARSRARTAPRWHRGPARDRGPIDHRVARTAQRLRGLLEERLVRRVARGRASGRDPRSASRAATGCRGRRPCAGGARVTDRRGRERPEDPDARVDHRRGRAQAREQRDLGVPALGRPWRRRSRARSRPVARRSSWEGRGRLTPPRACSIACRRRPIVRSSASDSGPFASSIARCAST